MTVFTNPRPDGGRILPGCRGISQLQRTGGQRKALTMLMTTLIAPRVLLLDERRAALELKTVGLILDLTREIVV